jgi:hypothetical protein
MVSRPATFFLGVTRWVAFSLALVLSGCDPLSLGDFFDRANKGGSILVLLSTDGRSVEIGDDVQGALSASDYLGLNDSYLEAWTLEAEAGTSFTLDLISEDFDALLYVMGPGMTEPLRDDDGGGACHSRITFTALEDGAFHVVASTSSGQTGTYRLRVSAEASAPDATSCGGINGASLASLPTAGRELRRGAGGFGRLSGAEASVENDRPVQVWALRGEAGERVTIRLEADDYDAYLYFFGPGMSETLTNDDGGYDLNSEITITLAETGTYTVGAGAHNPGSMGTYHLTLTDPIDLATLATHDRRLRAGTREFGQLTSADPVVEGQPVQAWAFRADAGQTVTIDLISDSFDSYLRVLGPGLGTLENDDGGDGLHSRLEVTFPENGVYRILASSLGGGTGIFTLQIR